MNQKQKNQFIDYCWSFYGPKQLYGEIFGHSLTKGELVAAVDAHIESPTFEGDSVDREAVRDIMIEARKPQRTENQIKRELNVLLKGALERVNEGYYGIAESNLKMALDSLEEASELKIKKERSA